ncbi:MAG: DinB family protein [Phycisphaerales bacterium]|nr:MAG: DinB family protein [Phycisphaerales bacterium]
MTAKDVIKNTINTCHDVLMAYLGDLGDKDLMVRAVPGANHLAWQLGHMIASEHQMLTEAGFTMPALPNGFAESYTKEAATSDDSAKFHKKEQYLTWLAEQRAATLAALDALSDADLDKQAPESMREYAPTIGVMFNIVGIHVCMHAAQFVAVRRKLGKPIVI